MRSEEEIRRTLKHIVEEHKRDQYCCHFNDYLHELDVVKVLKWVLEED